MDFEACKEKIFDILRHQLGEQLFYHCHEHTIDVLEGCKRLSDMEDVNEYNRYLIYTAALFHDSGFIHSPVEHEKRSAEIAAQMLPEFGYTQAEIEEIGRMIISTKLPQSPFDLNSSILCDADLDYLGRPDFFDIAPTLREEWKHMGKLFTDVEWLQLQKSFLSNHRYHCKSACNLRKETKEKNLQEVLRRLNGFENK